MGVSLSGSPEKSHREIAHFVDFRQLNKDTLKYYFPLPFIDQLLDTLSGNSIFPFLKVIVVITKF